MRALAITGIETALMIPSTMSGSDIRDTPPWARMSAGTRSSAITATAPASSAILACSGVTTSMITPPLSISAIPRLTRAEPVTVVVPVTGSDMTLLPRATTLLRAILPAQAVPAEGHRRSSGMPRPVERSLPRRGLGLVGRGFVDVEEARLGVAPGQAEQADQPAAAHGQGVPDQIGVHLPGQREATVGLIHPGQVGRVDLAGGRPQRMGQVVLGRFAVIRVRAQHRLGGGGHAGQSIAFTESDGSGGPPDRLGVQRGVGAGDPLVQP